MLQASVYDLGMDLNANDAMVNGIIVGFASKESLGLHGLQSGILQNWISCVHAGSSPVSDDRSDRGIYMFVISSPAWETDLFSPIYREFP
jgi:hypothetical protein